MFATTLRLLFLLLNIYLAISTAQDRSTYVLGPEDQIVIRALHAEEISDKPIRISSDGSIKLPLIGTVHTAGAYDCPGRSGSD